MNTNITENTITNKGEIYKKGAITTDCPFLALRVKNTRQAKLSDITSLINNVSIIGLTIKGANEITLTNTNNTKHYVLSGETRKNFKKALNAIARELLTIQEEINNLPKEV